MKKYKHLGVPTTVKHKDESYLEHEKLFVTDPAVNPFRIEWLRFEADSPVPEALKKNTHIAFEVDNLEKEIAGHEILQGPFETPEGYKHVFILHEGLPIELIQPPGDGGKE